MLSAVRRRLRFDLVSQALILLAVIVWIHWGLLADPSGCVNWGNFELPCTRTQYLAWSAPLLTWQPFSFMGAPLPLPFTTVVDQGTIWLPITGLSLALGPATGAKLFAVVSTWFLGVSFLLFSKGFVRGYWGRLSAALILIAGPFQLGLYGSGDYSQFVAQGFVFLSIYLLWLALNQRNERWAWFPLSFLSLILSMAIIQMFELGLLLYLASFVVFVLFGAPRASARLRAILPLAARFLLLPLALAPLLLPAILSPAVSLGPASAYALPLNNFRSASASPVVVFLGHAYLWGSGTSLTNSIGYAMVASSSGSGVALLWVGLATSLVVGVWLGIVLLGDRKGYALLALAVMGSLLGAGSQGPLAGFNTYLYRHLYGYQELYASYIWDWVVVIPATAAALGIVIDHVADRWATRAGVSKPSPTPADSAAPAATARWRERVACFGLRPRRLATGMIGVTVAVLLVVSALMPYALGDQYGPVQGQGNVSVGLQTAAYPSSYAELPGMLQRLVGSNYSGVAVFNPAPGWFLSNSTWVTPNYFLYYPTVRTPSLPSFGLPPYPVNFYTYWAYSEFYSNATTHFGQLLALEGIQFLLVFYAAESGTNFPFTAGVNASQLLRYQSEIAPIYSNGDFAVYRNLEYSGVVASLANLSVVAGDYTTLESLADRGLTLTDLGIVFPFDVPEGKCRQYLDRTGRVYAASADALNGLALDCASSGHSDPVDYLAPGEDVYGGWTSSYTSDGGALGRDFTDAWPSPLVASDGENHMIQIPVDVSPCPSPCHFWLPVRLGAQSHGGSTLTFEWQSAQWTLNTSREWHGYNNSMVWVQLPFDLTSGPQTLEVTTGLGYNAVGEVFAASNSTLDAWLAGLEAQASVIVLGAAPVPLSGGSDIVAAGGWKIASDTSGYSVSGGPSPLVFVRVPYAPNLAVGSRGATLGAAAGSVATLVWNPDNATTFRIAPSSGYDLATGMVILGITLGGWAVAELLWVRLPRRRYRSNQEGAAPRETHD